MFLKCATGTVLFPLTMYICYNIFACYLYCCEYHDLTAPGITSELHFVNVFTPVLVLRWDVMLLILKEDDTTGSFFLCHLWCVLSMISKSGALCTDIHLYSIIILQMIQQYICISVCYWLLHVWQIIQCMCINCSNECI